MGSNQRYYHPQPGRPGRHSLRWRRVGNTTADLYSADNNIRTACNHSSADYDYNTTSHNNNLCAAGYDDKRASCYNNRDLYYAFDHYCNHYSADHNDDDSHYLVNPDNNHIGSAGYDANVQHTDD